MGLRRLSMLVVALVLVVPGAVGSTSHARSPGQGDVAIESVIYAQDVDSSNTILWTVEVYVKTRTGAVPLGSKVIHEVYGCNKGRPSFRIRRTTTRANPHGGSVYVKAPILGKRSHFKSYVITPDGGVTSASGKYDLTYPGIPPRRCNLRAKRYTDGWKVRWKPKKAYAPPQAASAPEA